MDIEDCRQVLKFEIKLAESSGNMGNAFALLEALTEIDRRITAEQQERVA